VATHISPPPLLVVFLAPLLPPPLLRLSSHRCITLDYVVPPSSLGFSHFVSFSSYLPLGDFRACESPNFHQAELRIVFYVSSFFEGSPWVFFFFFFITKGSFAPSHVFLSKDFSRPYPLPDSGSLPVSPTGDPFPFFALLPFSIVEAVLAFRPSPPSLKDGSSSVILTQW